MDLRLTDYDMDLTLGELSFVMGAEAIAQDITMRLRTFLGECVYDRSAGVPYLQVIFERGVPEYAIEQIIRDRISATPGVTSIESLTLTVNTINRTGSIVAYIITIDGEIDFSFQIGDLI